MDWLGAAASLVGSYMQSSGAEDANRQNAEMASAQMQFQERMSSTAYQRAVADMKAAGLNPMLAYSQGGASTPGGSQAVMQNKFAGAASTATEAAKVSQELSNLKATERLTDAQTVKSAADADLASAQAAEVKAEFQSKNLDFGSPLDYKSIRNQAHFLNAQEMLTRIGVGSNNIDHIQQQIKNLKEGERLTKAQVGNTMTDTQLKAANTYLLEMQMPAARNKAESDATFWGRYMRPYLPDAGAVSHSALNAMRLFRPPMSARDLLKGKGK